MTSTHPAPPAADLSKDDIRNAVAGLLEVPADSIPDTDNLIRHGMDSIRMMRLAGGWRRAGADITFQRLAEQPTVERWHELLTTRPAPSTASARTALHPVDSAAAFDLTPVQRAYWIGRGDEMSLGGVGCHAYMEFDGSTVDPHRLEEAVRQVIARHEMLRARFLDDGRQQIAEQSPWQGLTVHDLTAFDAPTAERTLETVRDRLSHRRLDVARAEVLDVQLSLLPASRTRIHVNIDLLVADVASIEVLLTDLAEAYREPGRHTPAPGYGFAQYLADHRAWSEGPDTAGSPLTEAKDYWKGRIPALPLEGPRLPLAKRPEEIGRPRFSRRSFVLGTPQWLRITARAREHGLTPAMVLATAYAEILGAWSDDPDFLLNVPLFDRQPLHPAVSGMVADFTNLVLLHVDLRRRIPFADRAGELQQQLQQSASHAQYSTLNVLRDLRRANGGKRAGAPVVFACNLGSDFVGPQFRAALGELTWMLSQTPQVWLDHQVYRTDDSVLLAWDAVDELFPAGLLDDMMRSYQQMLDWLGAPDTEWTCPPPAIAGGAR
ncbi:condensation domain-containing protein [Kitasatospora sp. NBC_01539]|uniref:condensation domain-containing protein n=1 Tax=Kitasatospora sp. NBC_01539 TaxID=2903577 RepID=UPI003860280C